MIINNNITVSEIEEAMHLSNTIVDDENALPSD
jgi:hypothetical protein